jgi:hypothetical protein
MSEEIYFTPESKLGIVMRANVDIITAVASMEHYEESVEYMVNIINKHAELVYDISQKVVAAERLDIRRVK